MVWLLEGGWPALAFLSSRETYPEASPLDWEEVVCCVSSPAGSCTGIAPSPVCPLPVWVICPSCPQAMAVPWRFCYISFPPFPRRHERAIGHTGSEWHLWARRSLLKEHKRHPSVPAHVLSPSVHALLGC